MTTVDQSEETGTITAGTIITGTEASEREDRAVVCDGLTYRFGEHVAVNGVDLEIRHGETFGLLGPNGAGKTTTIRMLTTYITGLRDAMKGEGEVGGMTVLMTTHYMDEADIYCDRIALMHQGTIRAESVPADLKAGLGPEVTLDDVFRHYTGDTLEVAQGGIRDVRRARRTARRLG